MVVDALAALYINLVCMTKNRARKHSNSYYVH